MIAPSGSQFYRIGRWAGLILLFGAVVAYNSDFDPGKAWGALGGIAVVVAGYFAIQGLFVDPILAKLRELEYKIDRLSGKKTPLD